MDGFIFDPSEQLVTVVDSDIGGIDFIAISHILGDLDSDGDVDLSDLAQLLSRYGVQSGATYEDGDIDGDGDVDSSDLSILLANYGRGT